MMEDIRRICEAPTEEDRAWFPDIDGDPDWRSVLKNAWANYRDESFILQFLSPTVIRNFRLFALHDDSDEPHVEISKPAAVEADRIVKREVFRPYVAHASMAPSCAVARYDGSTLEVWSHSQGIFNLRRDIAMALKIEPDAVVVRHREGAGCYGHNGADDVAFDAAYIAFRRPGTPIRVMWSREDELSWSPFSSAMLVAMEAGLDQICHITGGLDAWTKAGGPVAGKD